jgi:ribose-phosphate pyrophosphokinase
MKLVSGNSNIELSQDIAKYLGIDLVKATIKKFPDKEIFVEIHENVRGEDVFVVQSTSFPANDHLMELLITIDALKRGSSKSIAAIMPYYGYARQDRKSGPRSPISAKLVANLISIAGANRALMVDLHAGQIQGFFDIPTDNLFAAPVFIDDIKKKFESKNTVIVSPDVGGVVRARAIAKRVDCDLAIIDKRREKASVSEVMNVIGEVSKKDCILIDDICDTAGTLTNAANALKNKNAKSVYAYITHGVLSDPAIERINNSPIDKMIITDSILARNDVKKSSKIEQLSIAPLIGEAIGRITENKSVSSLFA